MITKSVFKFSSEKISQLPKGTTPEIAFIGRSNVGKSSLINMLTATKGLAKVSGTPGKTRLINHFLINDRWYLVDLPGYGYARASKRTAEQFSKLILNYIFKSDNLHLLFVLVDARLEPQRIDLEFIEMLGRGGIPFAIVFTKADKLSKTQLAKSVEQYRKTLSEQWEELPAMFCSSSTSRQGREEITEYIEKSLIDCLQNRQSDCPKIEN